MVESKKLSNIQLEILKIFSVDLSEEQLREIKTLLANYFSNKIDQEMDKLFDQNSWGTEQIDKWSEEHMRTKYMDQ